MRYHKNSGYGQIMAYSTPLNTGKTFVVAASTDGNLQMLQEVWNIDPEGVTRLYSTVTLALAACVAGRSDKILLSDNFTVAPTLAELATAATKGVTMEIMGGKIGNDYVAVRATSTLPATTKTPLFTVTAPIRVLDIIGEVTTVVQTQTNNTKIVATPTVGSAVDLCANLDISAAAVGSTFTITGTLANAMINNVNGISIAQATPLIIPAGTIDLNTSATNTGSVKWLIRYIPLTNGAQVIVA